MSIPHDITKDQVSLADRIASIQGTYNSHRGAAIQQTNTSTEVKPIMKELRYPQGDLFIADLYSISNLFGDMASLEFPIFALQSTKTAKTFIRDRDGLKLTISPGTDPNKPEELLSIPTIYDADIWVYAISKLLKAADEGKPLRRTIRFTAYDFLVTTERSTGKMEYDRLLLSLQRLSRSKLRTTHEWREHINHAKFEVCERKEIKEFGFIDAFSIGRKTIIRKGKETTIMDYISITLPEWLFKAVELRAVLKLSPDYFRIDKPLHRRLYELARKHCGNQPAVTIALELLREKAGSTSALKLFKHQIKQVQAAGDLPDYQYTLNEATNIVTISRKKQQVAHEA